MSDKTSEKNANRFLLFFILTVFIVGIGGLIIILIRASLQSGAESTKLSLAISNRMAQLIFEQDVTEAELAAVNLIVRSMAHCVVFVLLGFGLCVIDYLIFGTKALRIAGLILTLFICNILAYYTEYYKQFVDGRHFQMGDVWLNYLGAILGMFIFLFTGFIFRVIHIRRYKKK